MALYQPRHITPDVRSGIGEGTVDVTQGMTVTWEINGPSAMTAFSIVIMSNNASSTQLYTTGKITDGCPAYGTASNGAIVPFSYTISAAALTMAGITNGNEYKLLITQWWSESESVTQSSASVFITRKEPTLAITPIETRAEITDLQTTIVPVQSGTGDPYPAGGGVNKLLPMSANWTDTKNDITIAYDASTETFSLSGTNSKTDAAWLIMNSSTFTLPTVAAGETWYFSHDLPTGLYGQITYRDGNNIAKTLGSSTGDGTWKTLAVTIPNDYDHWGNVQIGVYKTAGNVTKSAIHYEFSQTSPSAWTPYSNIRPISGWTGANIYVRGKNLLEKPIGYYSDISSTLAECFFIKAGTYTFSAASVTGATSWRYGVRVKDANGNNLSDEAHKPVTTGMFWNGSAQMWISASNITSLELRLTIAEDCYIRIVFASGNTTSLTEFANAQLELGSASTAYAAYQGNTYNISWQSEAGTVYFGTFDVTLGKLTSTHAAADLGSLTWADTQVATDKSGRTVYYSSSSRIAIPTPS